MLLLFETPAGYALFNVKKPKKLSKMGLEDFGPFMQSEEKLRKLVELQAFRPFKDTQDVLKSTVKLLKGKMSKVLKKFLGKNLTDGDALAVGSKKMAKLVKSHFEDIKVETSDRLQELSRCIRFNISSLIDGVTEESLREMSLGLAHGLGRYKLKFSADKMDSMVIQAVALHQDLDKEINNYMMRLKEWYGYHFPELGKIVTDGLQFAKLVRMIGIRTKVTTLDLSEEIADDIETEIKEAVQISMGNEISERDEELIWALADQVIELHSYRSSLESYIESRMMAVAPNLSTMIGETIAAKLIARAGSLMKLAKYPASTVQILGAEKALFKAMKSRKNTPKYGIIYQSKLVASANGKTKGRISRSMSAKCALCVRVDALGDDPDNSKGLEYRDYIEKRMATLTTQEEKAGARGYGRQQRGQGGFNRGGGGYNSGGDFMGKRGGGAMQGGYPKKKFKTE